MKSSLLVFLLLFSTIFLGCRQNEQVPGADGKIPVVATILPLADWASRVGGDRVDVHTLLPAGASPHTFDPTPRDMRLLSHAQLFLKTGLNMDDWGANLLRSTGKNPGKTLSLGDVLLTNGDLPDNGELDTITNLSHEAHDEDDGHDHGHDHGSVNPHFWLDPILAMKSVEIIRDKLIEIDPEGQAVYTDNADNYLAKLKKLDEDFATRLKPYNGTGIITFHNAWPYLALRYHLKIAAVIEEYAGKTPSEKYLRSLTDMLKSMKVRTIFSEPQLNPKVADLVAAEVGGNVFMLDPYGTASEPTRDTYLKVMLYNLEILLKAFSANPIETKPS